jgi:hypothetical protein
VQMIRLRYPREDQPLEPGTCFAQYRCRAGLGEARVGSSGHVGPRAVLICVRPVSDLDDGIEIWN